VRLRKATPADVAPLLALINGYADRNLLLRRSEESLRARLADFLVAEEAGGVVGCAALTPLGPGVGEVRSLAVREEHAGRGIGQQLVEALLVEAADRGFAEVLSLTRRVSFFERLGFEVTRRERFLDKLVTDCQACPLNVCCDETAMVRVPAGLHPLSPPGRGAGVRGTVEASRRPSPESMNVLTSVGSPASDCLSTPHPDCLSTPHPIPPHTGGGECCSAVGTASVADDLPDAGQVEEGASWS
jgi:amino-acid N-acetyltransferase